VGCNTPCSRTLATNCGSSATLSRTFSPISRVVGCRCSRVPVMITFWLGRGPTVFVCLLALEIGSASDAKAQGPGAGFFSATPGGASRKRSPRALGPEALRPPARRPESKGQKASQFSAWSRYRGGLGAQIAREQRTTNM
jgi:hypothetical protein